MPGWGSDKVAYEMETDWEDLESSEPETEEDSD